MYSIHFCLLLKPKPYELRTRPHNLTLTRKSRYYDNCNFISRMIFMACTDRYQLLVFALLLCGLP